LDNRYLGEALLFYCSLFSCPTALFSPANPALFSTANPATSEMKLVLLIDPRKESRRARGKESRRKETEEKREQTN
jgi:hypothetical protein